MRSTKIVTTFLKNQNKILILKRSQKVKTMRGLWSGISGIIENNEKPIKRAEIEIFEEVGIKDNEIKLLKIGEQMKGYFTNEAVVHAPESRTSSPIRIARDRITLEHPQIIGLYPCGEGAGYAGGIISAAIDGERCAEKC